VQLLWKEVWRFWKHLDLPYETAILYHTWRNVNQDTLESLAHSQ
jgi:hypothetical protein